MPLAKRLSTESSREGSRQEGDQNIPSVRSKGSAGAIPRSKFIIGLPCFGDAFNCYRLRMTSSTVLASGCLSSHGRLQRRLDRGQRPEGIALLLD